MKKKLFSCLCALAVMVCALMAAPLAACSGDDSSETLTIWAPQEEQTILPRMIEAFKEEYPEYADVKFSYKVMSVDNSVTELQKDNQTAADVFMFPSGGITELTSAGLILPLNIEKSEFDALYTENAVESVMLDNTIYAVPITLNLFIMYYNAEYYTEDEVKSLETMMAKDLGDNVDNFSITINDSWYLSTFFLSQENSLTAPTSDTIKCTFNDENGLKVGQYLIDLVNNSRFYAADGSGSDGNALQKGTLAALCSGTWSAADIKSYLGDNYRAAPLPTITIDGVEYNMSNFGDYKAYGVNSATSNSKLATLVAKWLGNETCQMIRYESSGDAPTVSSLLELEKVQEDLAVVAALEQEKVCTIQPKTSKLTGYWDAVQAFGEELLAGTITYDNLQDKLDKLIYNIEN